MIYTLMNKNIPVVEIEIADGTNFVRRVLDVCERDYAPLGMSVEDVFSVQKWINNRAIPSNRDSLRRGLSLIGDGVISSAELSIKSLALSLTDQYWLKPNDSNVSWSDINFFENDFSEDVGNALFDLVPTQADSLVSPDATSLGWLRKKWVCSNGDRYLLKAGSGTIMQEPYNEVIANIVAESLGIKHFTKYEVIDYKGKPVSVCKKFITTSTELVHASVFNEVFTQEPGADKYTFFLNCCNKLEIPNASECIDDFLILDYIIGNQDRHYGNIGFIRNVDTLKFEGFAPIFDCGTSLLYDTPTLDIDVSLDIESQSFKSFHSSQIKLVKNIDRYSIPNVSELTDRVKQVFDSLPFKSRMSEERADVLLKVLEHRAKSLDTLLSRKNNKGRSR